MKKFLLIAIIFLMISGCSTTPSSGGESPKTKENIEKKQNTPQEKTEQYPYNREMLQPKIEEMTNRKAIQYGFHETWTKDFIIPEEDYSVYKESCEQEGFQIINEENGNTITTIPFNEIKGGKKISIKDKYTGPGLQIKFSDGQKKFFTEHGRMIFKPNSEFLEQTKRMTSYEGEGNYPARGSEEWINNYQIIGGADEDYKRYPYNTIFITSDLLLHIYHKLFSNSLKYYETSKARLIMTDFSQNMFNKFSHLANKTTDTLIKEYYEFLAAYRAIPTAILIPNEELMDNIINRNSGEEYNGDEPDLNDDALKKLIIKRLNDLLPKIAKKYQSPLKETMNKVLTAKEFKGQNILLDAFSKSLRTSFGPMMLTFDYTQFTPRSHYATDNFLKTYFIAMKWMMRQKLYFADKNTAIAGLIMTNNIKDTDLKKFNELYTFIQKLIGEDDDTNITDMKNFINKLQRNSDSEIVKGMTEDIQNQLNKLKPQKIMSVAYQTANYNATTEQDAKNSTNGFILFGEKFTIDSWFFDQFTAGSAEAESAIKPYAQSALIIPDTLINTPITTQFVKLWMTNNKTKFNITDKQTTHYDKIKNEIIKNTTFTTFDRTKNIYHQWLDMLGRLMIKRNGFIPYFFKDPLYTNKSLNTYLGSYTELKHDTLLYVKQAYAEMGGGSDESCIFKTTPPTLPVPKGYVEPNIELIDALIKLSKNTNIFFQDKKYDEMITFFEFVKKIAIAQTKNEIISDEDFEKLRKYGSLLQEIMIPTKFFGEQLQKESRGSIIADIFTSGRFGPLYEAIGRPYLIAVMIKDINGSRIVIGPIFSHYEMYEGPFKAKNGGRYTDEDRQNAYDTLSSTTEQSLLSLPLQQLIHMHN